MIDGVVILLIAALLAYANGANDVSKGIATLVGSGVANYRRAILWGTLWAGLGGGVAFVVAGAMLATFGTGLLGADASPSFAAATASLAGAGVWVFIATRRRLPVSTTHALVGSVVGVGAAAYGVSAIAWSALGSGVAVPLLASPLAALVFTRLLSRGLTFGLGPSRAAADCICLTTKPAAQLAWTAPASTALIASPVIAELSLTAGDVNECRNAQPAALRITADHLHWLSSGAVSFARGVNDAPKIVALALSASALTSGSTGVKTPWLFALVTVGMVAGSLMAGRRVTQVLAEDVTPMDHREGLTANLVTATLVTAGAVYGLPMSTTHVSSGGIVGVGAERRSLNWKTLREIGLAWVVTLPASALLGAGAYVLARLLLS
ncbi:MAG: inorganic phosphate transporter [Acidobacteria bacterium]|nr:inorganic phosphate transporter [Acidobacteriota bacterium]